MAPSQARSQPAHPLPDHQGALTRMTVLVESTSITAMGTHPVETTAPAIRVPAQLNTTGQASAASGRRRHVDVGIEASATTEQLLCARCRLPACHPSRATLRARAIERNLPLARHLARRFVGRGEPFEDLAPVAAL